MIDHEFAIVLVIAGITAGPYVAMRLGRWVEQAERGRRR